MFNCGANLLLLNVVNIFQSEQTLCLGKGSNDFVCLNFVLYLPLLVSISYNYQYFSVLR